MIDDLTSDEKLLMNYMRDISEHCYDAGWMEHVEYVLWDAVTTGPRKYGRGQITKEDIQQLIQLYTKSNAWIIMDDKTEETAIDMGKWKKRFETEVKLNPGILYRSM